MSTLFGIIGPSGVGGLPLGVAAKRSVHYIWYYFSFSFFGVNFFLFYPKSSFFCYLKLHAKFHNPRTTPSGRKVCGGEEEEK